MIVKRSTYICISKIYIFLFVLVYVQTCLYADMSICSEVDKQTRKYVYMKMRIYESMEISREVINI